MRTWSEAAGSVGAAGNEAGPVIQPDPSLGPMATVGVA